MEKITKKTPASKRTIMIALAILMFLTSMGAGMIVHVVVNKVYGDSISDAKLSSSIAGLTIDNFIIEHHIGNNISSSFLNNVSTIPAATIIKNSTIPNKVHINTTAEIEKSMNDAVNYVNTHSNTNMSDPHYKPDSSSKRFKFGPDIEIPLNTYNYTLTNGSSY